MNKMQDRLVKPLPLDLLRQLAESDPGQFELVRHALIEEVIKACREKKQLSLRQLQFRIDGIRQRRSTYGAMLEIGELMWRRLDDLVDWLPLPADHTDEEAHPTSAKVLRFPGK